MQLRIFAVVLGAACGTADTSPPMPPRSPTPSPSPTVLSPSIMLSSHPIDSVAITVPTGVASVDGRLLFVAGAAGIDALDAASGAVAWSSADATLPVLALPGVLLAIQWRGGTGTLVAIDLVAPHVARASTAFELPLDRHRLVDARVEAGALEAGWIAEGGGSAPLAPRPQPIEGTLRVELASGAVAVTTGDRVPDAARRDLVGLASWRAPWRTRDGWSALIAVQGTRGLEVVLRHRPTTGGAVRSTVLVDTAHLDATGVLDATATHLFLRVCQPSTAPTSCELRVYDAETGAPIATIADVATPGPDRLDAPIAVIDRRLFATRIDLTRAARTLVAIDLDHAAAGPSWRRAIAPLPPLDVQP